MPTARYRVRVTYQASLDLERIIDFIDEENRFAAVEVAERLQRAIESLATLAHRGRHVPELGRHDDAHREVIVRPWRIIYWVVGERVEVLAVLDSRRDLADLILDRALGGRRPT